MKKKNHMLIDNPVTYYTKERELKLYCGKCCWRYTDTYQIPTAFFKGDQLRLWAAALHWKQYFFQEEHTTLWKFPYQPKNCVALISCTVNKSVKLWTLSKCLWFVNYSVILLAFKTIRCRKLSNQIENKLDYFQKWCATSKYVPCIKISWTFCSFTQTFTSACSCGLSLSTGFRLSMSSWNYKRKENSPSHFFNNSAIT